MPCKDYVTRKCCSLSFPFSLVQPILHLRNCKRWGGSRDMRSGISSTMVGSSDAQSPTVFRMHYMALLKGHSEGKKDKKGKRCNPCFSQPHGKDLHDASTVGLHFLTLSKEATLLLMAGQLIKQWLGTGGLTQTNLNQMTPMFCLLESLQCTGKWKLWRPKLLLAIQTTVSHVSVERELGQPIKVVNLTRFSEAK